MNPTEADLALHPIGRIASTLTNLADAPRQPDEGAPDAWLIIDAAYDDAMSDLSTGDEILLITWLDRADRSALQVHPRGDITRPPTGVFSTRSPDRPNPLGLHRVQILAIEPLRIHVNNLEALDGTPLLDIKPILGDATDR
jgi:tRNA-Thr(GGU) m(6)t(6)A37 methyltransferase TsaA